MSGNQTEQNKIAAIAVAEEGRGKDMVAPVQPVLSQTVPQNQINPVPLVPEGQSTEAVPLRTAVMRQLEYYFSDENLTKDRFLLQEFAKDESGQNYVNIEVLASFPRMKKLTMDIEEIKAAIKESSTLKLDKNGLKVKRKAPFHSTLTEEQQLEQRTVYVSYLPKNSDKESVKGIFGICGDIRRIDLPTDKKTGEIKGIAFVEFEGKKQAKKAIKYFGDKNNDFYKLGIRVKAYTSKNPFASAFSNTTSPTSNSPVSSGSSSTSSSPMSANSPQFVSTMTHTSPINIGNNNGQHHQGHPQQSSSPQHHSGNNKKSVYEELPTFNYSKERGRKKRSGSKPEQYDAKWEPDPSSAELRPKLNLRPRSNSNEGKNSTNGGILPIRQPKGPDGTKGFAAVQSMGRGKKVEVK